MKINIGNIKVQKKIEIGNLKFGIKKVYPELEDLEVTPTTEEQIFKSEKYGYNEVKVKGTEGLAEDLNVELTEQDSLITNQETKIEDIINALEGKSAGIVPEGTLDITENGEYDVTEKATANVNVPIGVFPEGTLEIDANDEYDVTNYEEVNVNVPIPEGYIKPEGSIEITANGEYDVTSYEKANVNVEADNFLVDYLSETKNELSAEDLEGLTSIRDFAFYKQTIESIELPNSLKSIGAHAFFGCQNLTDTIIIPDSVTSIGYRPFCETKITSIVIGSGITTWGTYVCYNIQSLVSATVNSKTLGTSLFQADHSLSKVIIGENVTSLGAYSFRECDGLTELICLAETPPTLENSVFLNANGDFIIKVPANSVEAYKTSTNWSSRADYIVAYEEV